jgi:hypothetical protein
MTLSAASLPCPPNTIALAGASSCFSKLLPPAREHLLVVARAHAEADHGQVPLVPGHEGRRVARREHDDRPLLDMGRHLLVPSRFLPLLLLTAMLAALRPAGVGPVQARHLEVAAPLHDNDDRGCAGGVSRCHHRPLHAPPSIKSSCV